MSQLNSTASETSPGTGRRDLAHKVDGNDSRDPEHSYRRILTTLRAQQHVFFSPETSPHRALISQSCSASDRSNSAGHDLPTMASLSLHPSLEAALHLLNADLPAAHFLLRHAEVPPAWECMYLHGILHRIEGDIDNARAWYGNAQDSEMMRSVWGRSTGFEGGRDLPGSGWRDFLDRVERWRDRTKRRQPMGPHVQDTGVPDWAHEEHDLRRISLTELDQVLGFCERKFDLVPTNDATEIWVRAEGALREKKKNMLVGGEGWREF